MSGAYVCGESTILINDAGMPGYFKVISYNMEADGCLLAFEFHPSRCGSLSFRKAQ